MTRAVLHLILTLALLAPPVSAQAPSTARVPAGSPRAVAERVLASLARKDAEAFTADVHPEELAGFRTNVVRILEQSVTPDQRAKGLEFFGPAKSVEELRRMPAARIFAAYMRGVFTRMGARGPVQVSHVILGEVPEGDGVVHVVYRARVSQGNQAMANVALLSLRRSPGGWKAMLTGDLQGLAAPEPSPGR
jgi:hypothetical protein